MHERTCAERHIDQKIHPVDIRTGHERIAAIGVDEPDQYTDIFRDTFEQFLREPRAGNGDRRHFQAHYDTARVRHHTVSENEEQERKRTDEEIQKRTEHVRAARDRVRIKQRRFPLEHVEQVLDKRTNLRGKIVACEGEILAERIHTVSKQRRHVRDEHNDRREKQRVIFIEKRACPRFEILSGNFFHISIVALFNFVCQRKNGLIKAVT